MLAIDECRSTVDHNVNRENGCDDPVDKVPLGRVSKGRLESEHERNRETVKNGQHDDEEIPVKFSLALMPHKAAVSSRLMEYIVTLTSFVSSHSLLCSLKIEYFLFFIC